LLRDSDSEVRFHAVRGLWRIGKDESAIPMLIDLLQDKQSRVRREDFYLIVKKDEKADLIDGVIYMASSENTDAADLFVWLLGLMGDFVEERELGQVFVPRVADG
jgi:hypothetical protein